MGGIVKAEKNSGLPKAPTEFTANISPFYISKQLQYHTREGGKDNRKREGGKIQCH